MRIVAVADTHTFKAELGGGLWPTDDTVFANVTTWECTRPPTVVDLDLATGVVAPVAVPPAHVPRQ